MNAPTNRSATPTPTPTPAPIAVVFVLLPLPVSDSGLAVGAEVPAAAPPEVLEEVPVSLVALVALVDCDVDAVVGDMLLVETVLRDDVAELEVPSAGYIQN